MNALAIALDCAQEKCLDEMVSSTHNHKEPVRFDDIMETSLIKQYVAAKELVSDYESRNPSFRQKARGREVNRHSDVRDDIELVQEERSTNLAMRSLIDDLPESPSSADQGEMSTTLDELLGPQDSYLSKNGGFLKMESENSMSSLEDHDPVHDADGPIRPKTTYYSNERFFPEPSRRQPQANRSGMALPYSTDEPMRHRTRYFLNDRGIPQRQKGTKKAPQEDPAGPVKAAEEYLKRKKHLKLSHRRGGPQMINVESQVKRPSHEDSESPFSADQPTRANNYFSNNRGGHLRPTSESHPTRSTMSSLDDPELARKNHVSKRRLLSQRQRGSVEPKKNRARDETSIVKASRHQKSISRRREPTESTRQMAMQQWSQPRYVTWDGQPVSYLHNSETRLISWRQDPEETASDWQIRVVRSESGNIDLYNVHRDILALGDRNGKYFKSLFEDTITSDLDTHRLRLEMPECLADVFPVLLDYIYGEDDIDSVQNRDQAFNVYDQAEAFGVLGLQHAVANWFRTRLDWYDVPAFLEEMKRFKKPEPLSKVAVETCAKHIEDLGPQFIADIGPSIFIQVLDLLASRDRHALHEQVDHIASLILGCCQLGPVDKKMFQDMTNIKYLPVVPPGAALKFLSFETGKGVPDKSNNKLSCLQTRCIRSLSRHWDYVCYEFTSAEEMADNLARLPSIVLAQLLVRPEIVPW